MSDWEEFYKLQREIPDLPTAVAYFLTEVIFLEGNRIVRHFHTLDHVYADNTPLWSHTEGFPALLEMEEKYLGLWYQNDVALSTLTAQSKFYLHIIRKDPRAISYQSWKSTARRTPVDPKEIQKKLGIYNG